MEGAGGLADGLVGEDVEAETVAAGCEGGDDPLRKAQAARDRLIGSMPMLIR
jgi:hypothetical protein